MNSYRRGFIALMSAIIISAVLLTVAATGSISGFFARSSVLDAESKERSAALADACIDMVLLRLSYDATYGGDETISMDDGDCEVFIAQNPFSTPRVFPLQTVFNHAYTNVLATIDIDTLILTKWEEIPVF